MNAETFGKNGLYFDELNKIRILDPAVAQETNELKEECKEFVDKIAEFQKIVDGFIQIVDNLEKEVEKAKVKALGSRNQLKSVTKQRESQQQQLQVLILEKKIQLERLRIQYESLKKEEADQNELIEQFLLQN
ncbi:intraflagellar transport 20 isoform X1 [Tachypleus tridentatus]|uniref:intraflagellar transport 20 isoform X1 n=1 Tax=Tachypleus tridentatus TaxID=6853 RepID=UPI003FD2912A